MASLNTLLIRLAALVTVLSLVCAGVPAAYQHAKLRAARELVERTREVINDDTTSYSVVADAVPILDSALTEAAQHEHMRGLLVEFTIGVPLIVWFGVLAVMWWFKDEELA